MKPSELSQILRRIATYIEKNPKPDKDIVVAGLRNLLNGLKVSADVKQFTKKEFESALSGLGELISRLDSVAYSMNPQDPQRASLEESITMFENMKKDLTNTFNGINAQV